MLASRLLSAALLIATVLVFVFMDAYHFAGAPAGVYLIPVYLFLTIATAHEMATLIANQHSVSIKSIVMSCGVACLFACIPITYPLISGKAYPDDCPIGKVGWAAVAVAVALVLLGIEALRYYGRTQQSVVARFSIGLMVCSYCIVLSHFLICIRLSSADYSGLALMVGVVVVTKMSDAGAYFSGRALGRHKLHAIISPKKTWEGACGGFLTAGVVSALFFPFLSAAVLRSPAAAESNLPFWGPAVTGIGIALFGLIGDLFESVIKRSVSAKDSSRLLPGLGGVWDVTDSLFFAAPFAYLAVLAGWIA